MLVIGNILQDLVSHGRRLVDQGAGSSAGSPPGLEIKGCRRCLRSKNWWKCLFGRFSCAFGWPSNGQSLFSFFFEGRLVNAGWSRSGISRPFCSQRVRRETSVWERCLLAITGQKPVATQWQAQGPALLWQAPMHGKGAGCAGETGTHPCRCRFTFPTWPWIPSATTGASLQTQGNNWGN